MAGTPQPETPASIYNIDQETSANAYFDAQVGEEAVRFMLTARHGATPETITACAESLIAAYAMLRGNHPKPDKPLPPPVQEHPAPEDGKKKYEKKPVPREQLPPDLPTGSAEGGDVDYFADDFDWLTVEPQPDDKASVKFWKQGLEFPVGAPINKWKHQTVATMLQALGEIDPSKAQKIVVAGRQYWTQGKEYEGRDGSKRHYKDLRAVEKSS